MAQHFGKRRLRYRQTDPPGQPVAVAGTHRKWCAGHHRRRRATHRSQLAGPGTGPGHAPLAHARGVALALEAEQPVWVDGEPTLLNELLSNLIDNALAYTPPGGNLVLRVLAPAVLEVEDDGPGIPEEERDIESIDSLLDDYCAGAAKPITFH